MTTAFKEWAIVCDALGCGRQSLLIRKGGIAEGRDGFAFKHAEFLLFPTWFHEQIKKTILNQNIELPPEPGDTIEIFYAASVEWTKFVSDRNILNKLREFHILHESVLDERFHYDDQQGVHIAFVRVFRLDPPITLRNEKKYGGCRSWIELPESNTAMISVIADEEHQSRKRMIERILGI